MNNKKTILVVDDSETNRLILCNILLTEGYDVIQAENGQEALDILTKKMNLISLVLLDIYMPVLDGYSLLKIMNEKEIIKKVPVIVTSGDDSENSEIKCLDVGASDYLKKTVQCISCKT